MKKTKPFRLAAMTASLFCALTLFPVPTYAQSSEPQPETTSPPAETEAQPETGHLLQCLCKADEH